MTKQLFVHRRLPERGQSLVEITLFLPILILLLIGLVEIGVLINSYISSLDSTRAAARYVSAQDPFTTRCYPFSGEGTNWISFNPDCTDGDYLTQAAQIKSWGTDLLYSRCQASTTRNFFYVAGCMAILNLPKGGLDPNPKSIWAPNDWPGDDVIVTTLPITNGVIMPSWPCTLGTCVGQHTWSLFGNQPTAAYPSIIDSNFQAVLGKYASAPPTGLVVVEVYHAHPQFIKLFAVASRMVGGTAIIPDPIPLHTYSVFPLPAVEPGRNG